MPPVKRRYLPSLGSFATFEVAAKHLSFTLAARELNITQGAVSQHIRLLERALEAHLFVRKHNALELTSDGAALLSAVSSGLDTISAAVAHMLPDAGPQVVTVSATDAMASYWLKPLIDSFRADHPEVGFVILASDEDDALRNYSDVDLSLLCGNERCEVGETLHFLFHEVVQPVCSPGYLEAHGPFDEAESLNGANLLHLHERHWNAPAIGWRPLGWDEWFHAQGSAWAKRPSSLTSNKVAILIDAALASEGVILGFQHMVRQHLASGRLVHAHPASLSAGRGNFLKCQSKSLSRPAVARFVDHLLSSLEPTASEGRQPVPID